MSSSSLGKESNSNGNTREDDSKQGNGTPLDSSEKPDILNPGPHDVLLGRGGGTNNHIGNKNFRDLVTRHKMRYLACSKVDKPKVAREVVNIWKKLEPPGRFLQRKDETKKGPGSVRDEDVVWTEVDDQEARKKASQCLRERTADVQPYIAHLRQQEDQQLSDDKVSAIADHAISSGGGGIHLPVAATRAISTGNILTDRVGAEQMIRMSNQNPMLRRGSMPATVHSSSVGLVPGLVTQAQATMKLQDRRISLPPTSQFVMQQQQLPQDITSWQDQGQRDSYTAIERNNDINNINLLQGQLHQQLVSNREAGMMQQQMMAMRSTMMQTPKVNQSMPDMRGGPVVGMAAMGTPPQQINRDAMFAQAMGGEAQRLMQRQQFLVQQHQLLLAEQERLVRQEHIIASREVALAHQQRLVTQMQQQMPSGFLDGQNVVSGADFAEVKLGVHDLEPVPLAEEEEYTIPLAGEPDAQPSSNVVASQSPRTVKAEAATTTANNDKKIKKEENSNKQSSTGRKKPDGDEMSDQTLDPTTPASLNDTIDTKSNLTEYRKLLESYISNHQNSIPSLGSNEDLDQDREEEVEVQTIDGVATSDWIEQQLMSDSGDLSMATRERPKLPRRSSSKKSLMSMTSSAEQMSFAFSEMDHFEDLSKEENKRSTNRSMSILSANTNMSELTDFDDLDCL